MTDDTDSESDTLQADGGTATQTPPETPDDEQSPDKEVAGALEKIRRARKRRALGWLATIGVVGFLFVQAIFAVRLPDENYQIDFFIDSLGDFFPTTDYFGVVPFIDFGEYLDYILENNLIFDSDKFFELFGDPMAFFFDGLGMFDMFGQAGITLAMGLAGTIMGFPLALTFGTLGSERVTPFPFNFLFRGTMSAIRSIPAIIWLLILIPFAGLGPASATFAIAVDTVGNLGRLFVDELEEIEEGPIEAMDMAGANYPQRVFFGMISQVRTSFIAWTLYILEINVRIAVTLGAFGAGGLGEVVDVERGLFNFDHVMATLICIFVLVISVEIFSQRLRSRLRSDEQKMGLWELITGFPDRMSESLLK
ncbi:phosphonate transport system permease protein [Halovenus aranensis]|uniref:Phosphonate transport system permease protein n=1 Tax=Halovenus aranensis TaxID=890420 RepID=A0A1G8TUP7_9EURY|nr:ABC transporter permease subunit [Halovenus aranensis]SDJ45203.1 phosphonate transport system permease protein [Halovenus aranensis]